MTVFVASFVQDSFTDLVIAIPLLVIGLVEENLRGRKYSFLTVLINQTS